VLRELEIEDKDEAKAGDKVSVEQFAPGDSITVVGTSKGKGFQGVVKRHHFRGGAATHGSMFHRAPGSIGASAFPSRVIPGMRAAGHMGSDRVTQKNLEVVRVDADNNLLVVKGSVPGGGGGYLVIRKG
jgi:large subunit ribosomal protein L3